MKKAASGQSAGGPAASSTPPTPQAALERELDQLSASVRQRFLAEKRVLSFDEYLSELLAMFNGNRELALAAYNAGENAVIRAGHRIPPYAETMHYVPKVLGLYRKFQTARL